MVSIDSWEYPAYFLVFQLKAKLTGYPLILGRPWLAIVDAYISCRAGNMNPCLKMDTVNIKRKQEEVERSLAIFCPRCIRRHLGNEWPLNSIKIFSICKENHSIDKCSSLSGLKVVYQGADGVTEHLCYFNQRRPHGPRPYQEGMQGSSHAYYNPNQTIVIPSQGPPAHPSQSTPPPWSYASQYHSQPGSQSFQPYTLP